MSSNDWFTMKKTDLYFLLGMFGIVVLLFLPFTYEIMIYNISLLAWGAYALHILIPAFAIWLIMRERKAEQGEDIT
ncbi:hypothetical protein [Mesobacillus harenae]|uniref:hypothetical protein n=1 Tax=Mesobacillus harenae TaxID=2213203 RepID=UPI0015801168|nr:hypothetical protein [Mesobacillus harenae]